MDSDLSHEAIARFEAIEARLDTLEGGAAEDTTVSEAPMFEVPEEPEDQT